MPSLLVAFSHLSHHRPVRRSQDSATPLELDETSRPMDIIRRIVGLSDWHKGSFKWPGGTCSRRSNPTSIASAHMRDMNAHATLSRPFLYEVVVSPFTCHRTPHDDTSYNSTGARFQHRCEVVLTTRSAASPDSNKCPSTSAALVQGTIHHHRSGSNFTTDQSTSVAYFLTRKVFNLRGVPGRTIDYEPPIPTKSLLSFLCSHVEHAVGQVSP